MLKVAITPLQFDTKITRKSIRNKLFSGNEALTTTRRKTEKRPQPSSFMSFLYKCS